MNTPMSRDERYASTWGTPVGQDCISLDITLAKWLGERMIFLSEHSNSYHPDYDHISWTARLAEHGRALVAYENHFQAEHDEQEAIRLKAQVAMMFVASHLGHLWD